MNIKDFFTKDDIYLKLDLKDKESILHKLSEIFSKKLNIDKNTLFRLFKTRENYLSTGIGEGIGLPHVFDDSINNLHICIITLKQSIDYDSIDKKPVNIIISIVANPSYNIVYLEIVAHFMKILQFKNIRKFIYNTNNNEEIYNIFTQGKINITELY